MNKFKSLLVAMAAGVLMSGSAGAAVVYNWTFDENGNGGSAGAHINLSHQQSTDSSTGIATLDYLWPLPNGPFFTLSQGWVAIYDDPAQTELSHLIHFGGFLNGQYQQIYYYSENQYGTLAENWPTTSQVNSILVGSSIVKVSENSDGLALYTPATSAQPGFLSGTGGAVTYTYTFITAVPEPGVYGAFAGALGFLCLGSGPLVRRFRLYRKSP